MTTPETTTVTLLEVKYSFFNYLHKHVVFVFPMLGYVSLEPAQLLAGASKNFTTAQWFYRGIDANSRFSATGVNNCIAVRFKKP